jgi:hypothetical protein
MKACFGCIIIKGYDLAQKRVLNNMFAHDVVVVGKNLYIV